jgi:hypothetical protein
MTTAILAMPRVLAALRDLLVHDAQLAARLSTAPAEFGGGPAVYTEGVVPPKARTDYLTLGPFTERSESTMGSGPKWGSALTTQIKLVTLSADVSKNLLTLDRLVALLHLQTLTVADYRHAWCTLDVIVDAYEETMTGEVLRHYPTLWSIHVGQQP